MNTQPDENLPNCRLFLMPPCGMDAGTMGERLATAAQAGDVACIVLPADKPLADKVMPIAHQRDIAVLIADDTRFAAYEKADGVHITSGTDDAVAARKSLGRSASVGCVSPDSRHAAMEAGETGIDYIAFDLSSPGGVDLLAWWTPLFEVPCVGINPTDYADCLEAIASGADFIMPPEELWTSNEQAEQIAADLTAAGNRSTG